MKKRHSSSVFSISSSVLRRRHRPNCLYFLLNDDDDEDENDVLCTDQHLIFAEIRLKRVILIQIIVFQMDNYFQIRLIRCHLFFCLSFCNHRHCRRGFCTEINLIGEGKKKKKGEEEEGKEEKEKQKILGERVQFSTHIHNHQCA